tara:strand:- start:378 stop:1043 length:666 start_codon:yes stop_codon:yes gene_type:complete
VFLSSVAYSQDKVIEKDKGKIKLKYLKKRDLTKYKSIDFPKNFDVFKTTYKYIKKKKEQNLYVKVYDESKGYKDSLLFSSKDNIKHIFVTGCEDFIIIVNNTMYLENYEIVDDGYESADTFSFLKIKLPKNFLIKDFELKHCESDGMFSNEYAPNEQPNLVEYMSQSHHKFELKNGETYYLAYQDFYLCDKLKKKYVLYKIKGEKIYNIKDEEIKVQITLE